MGTELSQSTNPWMEGAGCGTVHIHVLTIKGLGRNWAGFCALLVLVHLRGSWGQC